MGSAPPYVGGMMTPHVLSRYTASDRGFATPVTAATLPKPARLPTVMYNDSHMQLQSSLPRDCFLTDLVHRFTPSHSRLTVACTAGGLTRSVATLPKKALPASVSRRKRWKAATKGRCQAGCRFTCSPRSEMSADGMAAVGGGGRGQGWLGGARGPQSLQGQCAWK